MEETGMWDDEEKRHVGNAVVFRNWCARRYRAGEPRPLGESAGGWALAALTRPR